MRVLDSIFMLLAFVHSNDVNTGVVALVKLFVFLKCGRETVVRVAHWRSTPSTGNSYSNPIVKRNRLLVNF